MGIYKRGMHAVSACLLAGAVSFAVSFEAAAQTETDWEALSSSDWGKQTDDAEKVAEASGGGGDNLGASIRQAFVGLGMTEARAECYGKVLTEKLTPEGQKEAAQLVSSASSASDVKTGVISGGPEMVGGFSAADAACPEHMGG